MTQISYLDKVSLRVLSIISEFSHIELNIFMLPPPSGLAFLLGGWLVDLTVEGKVPTGICSGIQFPYIPDSLHFNLFLKSAKSICQSFF